MTQSKLGKLEVGVYDIPDNCRAVVRDGQVAIIAHSPHLDVPRCTSCIHCVSGCSSYAQRFEHRVCELRPKPNRGYVRPDLKDQPRFYAVQPYDTACDKYEPFTANTK